MESPIFVWSNGVLLDRTNPQRIHIIPSMIVQGILAMLRRYQASLEDVAGIFNLSLDAVKEISRKYY